MGKHSDASASSTRPFVIGGAALALVAVAVFGVLRVAASGGAPPAAGTRTSALSPASDPAVPTTSPSPATSTASATPTATVSSSPADAAALTALAACVARQQAAGPVVAAATAGVGHWREHLQAQTDVSSGRRSLVDAEATTWKSTREAGPQDDAAFGQAIASYSSAPGCVAPAEVPAGELKAKLAACGERQTAVDDNVTAAKAVMNDWRTHLIEMRQHADGHVGSAEAQARWTRAWQNAPTHLAPFDLAQTALASAPACTT